MKKGVLQGRSLRSKKTRQLACEVSQSLGLGFSSRSWKKDENCTCIRWLRIHSCGEIQAVFLHVTNVQLRVWEVPVFLPQHGRQHGLHTSNRRSFRSEFLVLSTWHLYQHRQWHCESPPPKCLQELQTLTSECPRKVIVDTIGQLYVISRNY